MKTSSLLVGALVAASKIAGVFAQSDEELIRGEQKPVEIPKVDTPTVQGCWSDRGNLTKSQVLPKDVSSGSCGKWCGDKKYTVFALHLQECWCGHMMPPEDDLVDDKKCNFECPGWPYEACGSLGNPSHYSFWNLGKDLNPPNYNPDDEEDDDEDEDKQTTTTTSSSPSQTSASGGESNTAAATTSTGSEPSNTADPSEDEGDSGGPNIAGIVAGVVSGIVAVAAACFGLWFYMRRKRNNEIEEEHRRNAAVNAFISGSKPPSSSGSISMTDSRLDPVMAHRRMSDGSIADNEDYSRKILRVTNA